MTVKERIVSCLGLTVLLAGLLVSPVRASAGFTLEITPEAVGPAELVIHYEGERPVGAADLILRMEQAHLTEPSGTVGSDLDYTEWVTQSNGETLVLLIADQGKAGELLRLPIRIESGAARIHLTVASAFDPTPINIARGIPEGFVWQMSGAPEPAPATPSPEPTEAPAEPTPEPTAMPEPTTEAPTPVPTIPPTDTTTTSTDTEALPAETTESVATELPTDPIDPSDSPATDVAPEPTDSTAVSVPTEPTSTGRSEASLSFTEITETVIPRPADRTQTVIAQRTEDRTATEGTRTFDTTEPGLSGSTETVESTAETDDASDPDRSLSERINNVLVAVIAILFIGVSLALAVFFIQNKR